jgi:hypothetical protein
MYCIKTIKLPNYRCRRIVSQRHRLAANRSQDIWGRPVRSTANAVASKHRPDDVDGARLSVLASNERWMRRRAINERRQCVSQVASNIDRDLDICPTAADAQHVSAIGMPG